MTTIKYPGNYIVTYTYDQLNRLETVTDWTSKTTRYTYDAAGRLILTTRPNGTTRRVTYDAAGQLRFITENGPAPAKELLWMRTLDYDEDGRIVKVLTWPTNVSPTAPPMNKKEHTRGQNILGVRFFFLL